MKYYEIAKTRFEVRDRVLYVYELLRTHSYGITVKEIINEIYSDFGVYVDRKSIYKDIDTISLYLPLINEKRDKKVYWRVMTQEDSLNEQD